MHIKSDVIDNIHIGLMSRVFANGPWRLVFNPKSSHPKDFRNT